MANPTPTISGYRTSQQLTDLDPDALFATIGLNDPAAGTDTATVTLPDPSLGTFGNTGPGTVSTDGRTYTVSGNTATVQAALRALTYVPTPRARPGTEVSQTLNLTFAAPGGSVAASIALDIIETPATTPVFLGTHAPAAISDRQTTTPFTGVTIDDATQGAQENVTITLSKLQGAAAPTGTLSGPGLTVDATGTTYTLAAGTPAAVAAALQAIVFTPNVALTPPGYAVPTDFSLTVTNASGASTTDSKTLLDTDTSGPVIFGLTTGSLSPAPLSLSTPDYAPLTPLATLAVGDFTTPTHASATVTLLAADGTPTDADGTLSAAGLTHSGTGTYTASGQLQDLVVLLDGALFTPTYGQVALGSTVTTTIRLTVNDDFGTNAASVLVSATAASNTPPALAGLPGTEAATDSADVLPFAGLTVTDPDAIANLSASSGQVLRATVTLSNAANGRLDPSNTVQGTSGQSFTISGDAQTVTATLQALAFRPVAHQVAPGGSVATGITVSVTDGIATTTAATTLTATAANTAPVILGGTTASGGGTVKPFSARLVDPDLGAALATVITVTDPSGTATDARGTLSGTGLSHTGAGTYALATNTPDAATAALDALVFTPAPGTTGQTSFTVTTSDGTASATAVATAGGTAPAAQKLVFIANDGTHGQEPFVSDGTAAGTFLLADINPGSPGSVPFVPPDPIQLGSAILFSATDGSGNIRLWRTDGTPAGTNPVLPSGTLATRPDDFTLLGGTLLFNGNDGAGGRAIFATDGTAAGTREVLDINAEQSDSLGGAYFVQNGRAYFTATDAAHGNELWTTDGTTAGTFLVKDINPGTASSISTQGHAFAATAVGNSFIFSADDGVHGSEPWISDGTTAGTRLLADLAPGAAASASYSEFATLGTRAVFSASGGNGVFITDGTTAGTQLLAPAAAYGGGFEFTTFGAQVLFLGENPNDFTEQLWVTDGTAAGTRLLAPGVISGSASAIVPLGGKVYVTTQNAAFTQYSLYVTDGTDAGTQQVQLGTTFRYIRPQSVLNGQIAFTGDDGVHGEELWLTDGTAAGTRLVSDIDPGTAGSVPSYVTPLATAVATLNAPPLIAGTLAGQRTPQMTALAPFAAATVADPDPGQTETATLTLLVGGVASDADGTLSGAGLTRTGTGTYALVSGSTDVVTAALRQLVFTPVANLPAAGTATTTIALTVSDGTASATDTATSVIAVAGVGQPAIAGTVAGQVSPALAALRPFARASVTDPNAAAATSATITLLNATGTPSDALGTLSGAGLARSGTGTYTLAAGTPAALTAQLAALVYAPASEGLPGQAVVTRLAVAVADQYGATAADSTTSVSAQYPATAVLSAPLIFGTVSGQPTSDRAAVTPFSGVVLADPVPNLQETVTITLTASGTATDADGTLSGTGLTRTGTGTYTLAAASISAEQAALRTLVFTPTAGQAAPGGSITTRFGLTLSDGAASVADSTTSVVATAPGSPVIAGVSTGQTTSDRAAVQPFSTVVLADPNANLAEAVTITVTAGGAATDADGTLSGAGLTKTGTGTYALASGSIGAVQAALRALSFTPTAGQVAAGQSVTTGFTIALSDGVASTSNAATSVVATAPAAVVPGSPVIAGTVAGQATSDRAAVQPFGAVVLSDPTPNLTEALTITLTASGTATDADGTLSGAGLTKTGTGTYALTPGSVGTVQAALRALTFTPTAGQVAAGSAVTTAFALTLSDGVAAATTDGTTSVVATAAGLLHPFAGLAASNPDAAATVTVVAQVNPATAGSFGNFGTAVLSADGQSLTVAGTAAQVTALLQGVVFIPAGQTGALSFAASVSDTAGTSTLRNTGATGGVLQAGAAGDQVTAGSGPDTLVAAAAGTHLVGGSGRDVFLGSASAAATLTGGAGGSVFFARGGATRIEGGTGADTVSAASGNVTVVSGSGGSVIGLGSGTALVNGNGRDTIIGGGGPAVIGAATGSVVGLGTGSAVVSAASGATVIGGAGADTVGVRGAGVVFFEGSGPSLLIGGIGSSTAVAGTGSATLFGAAGGGVLSGGGAGHNVIVAGQQATTVFGGGDGDVLFAAGSGGDVLVAAAGNATLQGVGSSGADTFFAGAGNDLIGLGSGADVVFAGTGASTVVGGAGRDVLAFVNGRAGGTQTVIGFKVGTDQISLQGYAPGEIARALAGATTAAGTATAAASTTLTLSDNTRVILLGVAAPDARMFG